jgi:pilus assembly protein CpaD
MKKYSLLLAATLLAGCQMNAKDTNTPMEMSGDYRIRHPIMVTPQQAYVPHQCGKFPDDLGTAFVSVQNKQDYNYGCATQSNLAAMIKNPNDLLEPRMEGPIDARRRQTVITKFREGQDPTTPWKIDDRNKVSTKAGG